MAMVASNRGVFSVQMQQPPLPCPSQALLFDLASCDTHPDCRHLRSQHDEVNVFLCLTCGSPVFRDDDEQDSDLTSPFCMDCFSMFHSRDGFYDDIDLHDDASMTDMDDDHDHEDFHASCHAGSRASNGPAVSSSVGFGFLARGNATMSAA